MVSAITAIIVAFIVALCIGALKSILYWALALAVCLYVAVIAELFTKERIKGAKERRAKRKAMRERADKEHQQVLNGDIAGMYGAYPPADLGGDTPYWISRYC